MQLLIRFMTILLTFLQCSIIFGNLLIDLFQNMLLLRYKVLPIRDIHDIPSLRFSPFESLFRKTNLPLGKLSTVLVIISFPCRATTIQIW